MPKQTNSSEIKRNTLRNLGSFLARGDFIEIAKILRRRLLNALKLLRRIVFKLVGIYYDHPSVRRRREQKQLRRLLVNNFGWKVPGPRENRIGVTIIARDGDTYPKSSAFIRLISPLTDPLVRDMIALQLAPENTPSVSKGTNICIIQRNAYDNIEAAQALVRSVREVGAKLVIDSDDAFHVIDTTHPEHEAHSSTLEAFDYLARQADQLWLSTERLVAYFRDINPHPILVNNSLDKRLWGQGDTSSLDPSDDKPLRLIYMGTVSHRADLDMIFPALDNVASVYPGSFELTVIGVSSHLPERDWIKRVYQKRGGSIYPRFIPWLTKQGPFDIGLSPLVDNEFNQGKSDIKCLDYIAMGCVPLVSEIEPYQTSDMRDYMILADNSIKSWESALTKAVANRQAFRKQYRPLVAQAQEYLWANRSSAATATKLLELLKTDAKT